MTASSKTSRGIWIKSIEDKKNKEESEDKRQVSRSRSPGSSKTAWSFFSSLPLRPRSRPAGRFEGFGDLPRCAAWVGVVVVAVRHRPGWWMCGSLLISWSRLKLRDSSPDAFFDLFYALSSARGRFHLDQVDRIPCGMTPVVQISRISKPHMTIISGELFQATCLTASSSIARSKATLNPAKVRA